MSIKKWLDLDGRLVSLLKKKITELKDYILDNCKNIKLEKVDTSQPKGCKSVTKYEYENINTLIKNLKKFRR